MAAGMGAHMMAPGMPPHMMMAMMMGRMGNMPPGHNHMANMPPQGMHAAMRAPMGSAPMGSAPIQPPPPTPPPAPPTMTLEEEEEKMRVEEEKRREEEWAAKIEADKKELLRRKKEFKQVLLEKSVTPGGVWEKELPKFCFDKRCDALLPLASDRKAVFLTLSRADLVKFNAGKKERLAGRREKALAAVKVLICSAHLTATSTLSDFWAGVCDDERLLGLDEKDKKMLQMFNLRIEPIRAAHREEENKAREVFLDLLKGDLSINTDTSTSSRFMLRVAKGAKAHQVSVLRLPEYLSPLHPLFTDITHKQTSIYRHHSQTYITLTNIHHTHKS